MWKLYGIQISVSIMLWLLPVKSVKMCFLSRSINTYIIFSISPVCQQSLKYILSGPLHRKLVDPCLEAFILHLNPRHSGSQQSECCHATQGLNLRRDSTGEKFYIQKRLRLGHRKGRRICLGLSQDGNDPNRREMYRHKANSGRKQLPSPLGDVMWPRYDGALRVVPVLSPLDSTLFIPLPSSFHYWAIGVLLRLSWETRKEGVCKAECTALSVP